MKKLTAMLLSLTMCLSLLAVPAQATFAPDPNGPVIADGDGTEDPVNPGNEDPTDPGDEDQNNKEDPVQPNMPGLRDTVPTD